MSSPQTASEQSDTLPTTNDTTINNTTNVTSTNNTSTTYTNKILTLKTMYGVNKHVRNNIWFIDDVNVVYSAGRTLVFQNMTLSANPASSNNNNNNNTNTTTTTTNTITNNNTTNNNTNTNNNNNNNPGGQTYIKGSRDSLGITCMCLVPNRKYIAVAEKGRVSPSITFYDTSSRKKKKIINYADMGSQEIVHLTFSDDGKFMLAQGGAPNYKLVMWSMEGKSKVIASIGTSTDSKEPVYQCSFSPDCRSICVSGNGVFKLLKYEDGNLKIVCNSLSSSSESSSEEYMCHRWIDSYRLIVANRNADLFLVENMEFKASIPSAPSDGGGIYSIISYGKGFICCGDNGSVMMFEMDDVEVFKRQKTMKLSNATFEINDIEYSDLFNTSTTTNNNNNNNNNSSSSTTNNNNTNSGGGGVMRGTSIAISPSLETLAISTTNGQIFTVSLAKIHMLQDADIQFSYLVKPFHSGRICAVDACIRKPLVVTGGMDKTIRIWNYNDNTVEALKKFNNEIISLAMHPNGLHLAVGFHDKLRFMNILGNDIREAKSFHLRNCIEVKFSNGGQYFAAVHGNVINIYSTYSLSQVTSLRGHSGKIRSIYWLDDDSGILSSGMDGALYEFELESENKTVHHYNKSCEYTGIVHDGKSVFAVGTDKTIREFQESELICELAMNQLTSTTTSTATTSSTTTTTTVVDTMVDSYAMYSLAIANAQKMLYAGTTDGGIKVIGLPSLEVVIDEIYCHGDVVSKLKLIHDESMLISISGGDECTICIFEVRDREGSRLKRDVKYSEEILIAATELDEKNNAILELKTQVADLRSDNEYEQKMKSLEYSKKLASQAALYGAEIKKKDEKIVQMRTIIDQTKTGLDKKLEELAEEHIRDLAKKEKECQDKITGFLHQIQHLKNEFNADRDKLIEKYKDNEEVQGSEISKITESHEDEVSIERQKYDGLKNEYEKAERSYLERIRQIEEDRDKEIEKLRHDFQEKSKSLQHSISGLSGDRKSAVADRDKMNIQLQQIMKEGKVKDLKLKELKERKNFFEQNALTLKNENREREDTIVEKEKRIFELKRQNQELEKFKFVLQYKITTLEEEIRPNKDTINRLRREMKEMEKQLDLVKESNEQKVKLSQELQNQINDKNSQIQKVRNKLKDNEVFKSRIRAEIHDIVQNIQEPKKLKEDIRNLYQKYVNQTIEKQGLHFDILNEYERQSVYLEKTVESLKKKLMKATETSKGNTNRIIQENMALIKEINILRKDVKLLQSKLRDKEEGHIPSLKKANLLKNHLSASDLSLEEARRNIEMQKISIQNLQDQIAEFEEDLQTT